MLHRILGASVLTALAPGRDPRPVLDEVAGLGFNLVRIFCGALPWASQDLSHVYANLPGVLQACSDRGLNAYLAYHTEAGTGYDLEQHTDEVEAIAGTYPVVVLREVANEADHPTQGDRLSPDRCADLADRMNGPVLHGATITDDESMLYAGREGNAVHLDRGRDPWNMVRRVREIYGRSEENGLPSTNQEPIGADEVEQPGKRLTDPAIFDTMGALGRLFDVLSLFHSEDGLQTRTMRPVTKACAQAFVRGFRAWSGAEELQYRNTGHDGSPVKAANFDRVIRVYSGVVPDWRSALTVVLGLQSSLDHAGVELNAGWQWGTLLEQATAQDGKLLQVWRTTSDGTRQHSPVVQQAYPPDPFLRPCGGGRDAYRR